MGHRWQSMQLGTLRSQCFRRTGRLIAFTALLYFLTCFSTSPSLLAFYSVSGLSEPEAIADKAHADALSEWSARVPQELQRTAELLSRVALTSLNGADRPAGRPSAASCGRNGRQAPKPHAAFVGSQLVHCLELSVHDEGCWSAKQALLQAFIAERMRTATATIFTTHWESGVGSDINVMGRVFALALEKHACLVPTGRWIFLENSGLCAPEAQNWLCMFRDFCTPRAGTGRAFWPPEPVLSFESRMLNNNSKRVSFDLIKMADQVSGLKPRILDDLAELLHVPRYVIWGGLLTYMLRFRRPFDELVQQEVCRSTSAGDGRGLKIGVHYRAAEFSHQDGRAALPLDVYIRHVDQINAETPVRLVYFASDVPNITTEFLTAEYPNRSFTFVRPARSLAPAGVEAAAFVRGSNRAGAGNKSSLVLDVFRDIETLAACDGFLGTGSNWMILITSLMTAAVPPSRRCAVIQPTDLGRSAADEPAVVCGAELDHMIGSFFFNK